MLRELSLGERKVEMSGPVQCCAHDSDLPDDRAHLSTLLTPALTQPVRFVVCEARQSHFHRSTADLTP